jgi:hypothetical protein
MDDYISHLMYLVDALQLQVPFVIVLSVFSVGLFVAVLIRLFGWADRNNEMENELEDFADNTVIDWDTTSIADRNDNVIFRCRIRFSPYKSYPTRRG